MRIDSDVEEALWLTRKWLYHNPYNLKPKGELGLTIAERTLGQSDDPVDKQALAMTGSWLVPLYLAKGLAKAGMIQPAAYGYWRTAAIVPRGLAIVGTANVLYLGYLANQTHHLVFTAMRAGAKSAQPKVHIGGHRSFTNPITGM